MTSRKKLVRFMQEKASRIKETGCRYKYFTAKDEQDIMSWSMGKTDEIWEKIVLCIEKKGAETLCVGVCPFCLYYGSDLCGDCSYGKRHKICINYGSIYDKIMHYIGPEEYTLFSNEWYKEVIKKIEKGGKK